jgi:transcriptional regulator with XRE-family HTH domain
MAHVGARIAAERKLTGLSQTQLAQRMSYSLSMVRAVEQGREPASAGFVAAAARALHVEPEQLTGAPYRREIEQDGGPLEGLPELRVLLAEGMDVEASEPKSAAEAHAELATIDAAHRGDKGRVALNNLYVLIRQLYGALHAADSDAERSRVFTMLAHAYMAAGKACHRLQFLTLATQAYDRMEWAARYPWRCTA